MFPDPSLPVSLGHCYCLGRLATAGNLFSCTALVLGSFCCIRLQGRNHLTRKTGIASAIASKTRKVINTIIISCPRSHLLCRLPHALLSLLTNCLINKLLKLQSLPAQHPLHHIAVPYQSPAVIEQNHPLCCIPTPPIRIFSIFSACRCGALQAVLR